MKFLSNSGLSKTLTISSMEEASETVKRVEQEPVEIRHDQNSGMVLPKSEDSSNSLIGNECPFATKMNQLHIPAKQQAKCDMSTLKSGRKPSKPSEKHRCQIQSNSIELQASLKQNKKTKLKILWSTRKNSTQSESMSSHDEGLFDRDLKDICDHDEMIAKPILNILAVLFKKGPSFVGIFRKSANAKACKELIDKLNTANDVTLEELPIVQLAVVFKEFLRRIPDSLLTTALYDSWMAAMEKEDVNERTVELKQLLTELPSHNTTLLRYFFCVLYYINKHSEVNKMNAHNLAICIGPNMLWPTKPVTAELQKEVLARVVDLMQFLIENCCLILGDDITTLLGEPVLVLPECSDKADMLSSQQNDSAYDSTDQDDWKDGWNEKRRRANSSCYQLLRSNGELRMDRKQNGKMDIDAGDCTTTSCSTESMDATYGIPLRAEATPPPALTIEHYTVRINRRCSLPIIGFNSSSKMINQQELLARSHDDCSISSEGLHFNRQQMAKQVSAESFTKFSGSIAGNLNASSHSELSIASSSKASSISSLASSYSNISENSVFINSPLVSPTYCSEENSSFSECPEKLQANSIQVPDNNAKPMKETVKKLLRKTQSWDPARTFNTNQKSCKENSWKEKVPTCETVHEDQVNQSNTVRYRARTISIDEVFQQVDSKRLCNPPPYQQAVEENNPIPPDVTRKGMTVKNMRRLSQLEEVKKLYCPVIVQKTRPCSLTEDLLYSSWQDHCTNHFDSCAKQGQPKPADPCEESHNNFENDMHPTGFEKAQQYRGRAMSECIRRSNHEQFCRHFSQSLEDYEQIQHAKESCV
ncbi:hypothetical protein chiPu_0002639 [Chiloscyllium punctatum]|uniref:Rho-GAP domain-containing protein n=1 Tax=Chiloscyllium punctatum TaxID=137246 RepID=A0A401S1H5_CHIPU|nr:hypothetical protein [Chiloscyllium punctatum]